MAAASVIRKVNHARVKAVFNRSCYLDSSAGLVCIGLPGIGDGPLNILLQGHASRLLLAVAVGEQVNVSGARLIGQCWSIDLEFAARVHPVEVFPHVNQSLVRRHRHQLSMMRDVPTCGFAFLLGSCGAPACQTTADNLHKTVDTLDIEFRALMHTPVSALAQWLISVFSSRCASLDMRVISKLPGAGPGLTPSGDDLLAGVMLALHRLHYPEAAAMLWRQLAPMLATRTNAISAAHLGQAAIGQCNALMHLALSELMASEKWQELQFRERFCDRMNSMGATSGWDTLAGACLVIDAWLAVTQQRRHSPAQAL